MICQNGENFEDLAHAYQQQDTNVTDLEPEVNKARFYKNNQYGLHSTLSSTQSESLHDECSVNPAISLRGDPLDPVNPIHSDVPQFIIVVTAFVEMERITPAIVRELCRCKPD